jgi:hypothetical protein
MENITLTINQMQELELLRTLHPEKTIDELIDLLLNDPWEKPAPEVMEDAIKVLGGVKVVGYLVKKTTRTINRWRTGEANIDYANWKLISDAIGNL